MKHTILLLLLCLSFGSSNLIYAQDDSGADQNIQEQVFEDGLNYDKASHSLIYSSEGEIKKIPLWMSILPPLIAIVLALIFREVHSALIAGILVGIIIINGASFAAIPGSILQIVDTYLIQAVMPSDGGTGHLSIIVFSMLIGGMVAVISNNGGMKGIVAKVSLLATSGRRAQFATWLMGLIIFFDDYANTLVVGNTMRPLTDKFKISREKLAYLVDSTAAPIAAIGLVTTWIGFQLSEIEKGMSLQSYVTQEFNVYGLFIGSLQYALYPILTIFFVLLLILSKRDFGPMRKAEMKASEQLSFTNNEKEKTESNHAWIKGAIPIIVLVLTVGIGIYSTGYSDELAGKGFFKKIQLAVADGDSYVALLWASLCGSLAAIFMSIVSRSMSLKDTIESYMEGLKNMLPAVAILILAWSLALVIEQVHTSDFLIGLVPEDGNARWLPMVFFIISAVISFSTGSSWSTMAIMYPICIPLVLGMATANGSIEDVNIYMPVLLNTISVILAASVFGDHCSPISDTTILSSLASDCNHIAHVKTQMPYALAVGFISLFCGCVLFALGVPWFVNYIIGAGLVVAVVYGVGRPLES